MQEFIDKLKILSENSNVIPLICDEELMTVLGREQLEKDRYKWLNGDIGTSRVLISTIDHCITIR